MPEDPRPDFEPGWDVCMRTGCRGVRTEWEPHCLVHTNDLSRLEPGADLDLRGVAVTSTQLKDLRARFRDDDLRRYVFGDVRCEHAWFTGRAWFDETEIRGSASFRDTHFGYLARFDGIACAGALVFRDARFAGKALMSGMTAQRIDLNRAWFVSRVEIDAQVDELTCVDGRFEAGVVLKTIGLVDASGAYFGAPSTISLARVTSLAGSDASNLVLDETDLSSCVFLGAHRLELLRIDGRTEFARPAQWWRARRRMLFEEGVANPARMAAVYRALRKSFEDNKFEAGAGDFYYGEMECRRRSDASSGSERVILWFYWLLSGYGQRASRALIALLVVITTATTLLTVLGQDFGMAARTALNAVVFRDDQLNLTAASEWTVLIARVLGPLLLALAVLAIRARVKR